MKRKTSPGIAVAVAVLFAGPSAFAGDEPAGKAVFLASKCQSCHTVKSASIAAESGDPADAPAEGATAATDLSNAGGGKLNADAMKGYLTRKEMLDGKKHRKKFAGTDEELGTLVAWLMTLKAEAAK